ncbi:UbiA family prenyltransferase [Phycisphaera mikurensis]|uniref:Putative prenyltransferase n=1 Tax=Phycisphaera mikurensis (strain NBRC 102666 / KCTC 22515 / FYK2301M01) TaxID=1142394 RepID=I0IF53_PHYMF|nr:UbiA family prenyltransferase [Phycisphaera mikurensis]MBB6440713.1 4-hydroxybenzoate polyprenyltransferase [Phycisphaera mikurensis]BAM03891.1 putative prenyltransferase [Phycisphaera mikurensis NBRC 102666]
MSVFAAWARLLRVANAPSAWSNAVLGLAVGAAAATTPRGVGPAPLPTLLNEGFLLLVSATLFYAGAMAMNDAADAATDLRERPGRPVPSGAVSQRAAHRAGKLGVIGGLAALVAYPQPEVVGLGTLLALSIVLYNALHLRHAWTVALPALCRGLLVAIAVLVVPAAGPTDAVVPALVVAAAVLAVSAYARREAEHPGRPARVGRLLGSLPALDAVLVLLLAGNPEAAVFCIGCGVLGFIGQRFAAAS